MYFYKAKVLRVIDGDTLELLIDQGFRQFRREKVRLLSVDAPEVTGKEKPMGLKVEKLLTELLELYDNDIFVQTEKQDSFGRWLANISVMQEGPRDTVNEKVREWTRQEIEKQNNRGD